MHRLLYPLLGLLVLSCADSSDCCTNISNLILLYYQDDSGLSHIDSSFNKANSAVNVYYLTDNGFTLQVNGNLDNPKMHDYLQDNDGKYLMSVFLSDYYTDARSTTIVDFDGVSKDTIVGTFDLTNGNEILRTFTVNGEGPFEEQAVLIR